MSVALLLKMVNRTTIEGNPPPAKITDIRRALGVIVCQFSENGDSIEDCANWLMGVVVEWLEDHKDYTRPRVTVFPFDHIVQVRWLNA